MSINDTRAENKKALRSKLSRWEEVSVEFVDGKDSAQVSMALGEYDLTINSERRLGQIGFWCSTMRALDYAPLFLVEDDAVLVPGFTSKAEKVLRACPEDLDFLTLMVPLDHLDKFDAERDYINKIVCRVYQPGATACIFYSEKGAERIRALIDRDGVASQYDAQVFSYARTGELNGYTTYPFREKLAGVAQLPSQTQTLEVYRG